MIIPLPSPALSASDSLDGIDDLDAFLASKGPLSRFATPPPLLKKTASVETFEVFDDEDEYDEDDEVDYNRAASLFADETCNGAIPATCEIDLVYDVLARARLPAEVLAMSYNIIRRYSALKSFGSCHAADLLTVSALSLAVTYVDDHPPRSSWWSRFVCNDLWAAADIDGMMLHMLVTMDWRLHCLSSPQALERGMTLLLPPPPPLLASRLKETYETQSPTTKLAPLAIPIEDTMSCWLYGQLTPDASPPGSALEQPEKNFLRLL